MLDEGGPRRVVPRWRASWVSAQTPEGQPLKAGTQPDFGPSLARAKSEFDASPTEIPLAAELMFIATQAGDGALAAEAAGRILAVRDRIGSSSLIKAAERVAGQAGTEFFLGNARQFIHEARRVLMTDFDNPILLIDVAWAMTASGSSEAAERFVRTALALAPQNRFVVRSAVRYFLHRGMRDRAHSILLRSTLLHGDPWIQASEIAVATVLGKTSKLVKAADRHLESMKVLPASVSELSSAVATVHLNAGSDKKAKRLFSRSLIRPNDNVVAQAEWASRKLGLVVPEAALNVRLSFEANSAHSYRNLDIDNAIEQAKFWKEDEPFASRPVGWLGHLFAINDDFERASEYYQAVLDLEKDHDTGDLLNQNFSRIETGALEQAAQQLMRLSRADDASYHRPQILANAGALAYASGEISSGRELYERAAMAARYAGETRTEAVVRSFFARAAVKYGDPQSAHIVAEVSSLPIISLSPSATHVARRLVDDQTRKTLEASAAKKVARQQLHWDPVTNVLTLK